MYLTFRACATSCVGYFLHLLLRTSETRITNLYSISLALLHLLERLHGSVESVLVVSSELRIRALQGWVSVCLWLVDTAHVVLVMIREDPPRVNCQSVQAEDSCHRGFDGRKRRVIAHPFL